MKYAKLLKNSALLFCFFAAPALAGEVNYGENKKVSLSPEFETPMQCLLDGLKEKGYVPKDVGCFGTRPSNRSAHPTGHACDVDQTARDISLINSCVSREAQIEIADKCKAVSGCIWPHPDCGHFEQVSAPYSPAGTGIHYYGESYANHSLQLR